MLKAMIVFGASLLCAACHEASIPECEFRVTTGRFVSKDHRLTYYNDGTTVIGIDGHEPSGTDGDIPQSEIRFLSLQLGSTTCDVPPEAYASVFNPHVDCPEGCMLKCTSPALLRLTGGDGAGAYTVEWYVDTNAEPAVLRHIWEQPNPDEVKTRRFPLEVRR